MHRCDIAHTHAWNSSCTECLSIHSSCKYIPVVCKLIGLRSTPKFDSSTFALFSTLLLLLYSTFYWFLIQTTWNEVARFVLTWLQLLALNVYIGNIKFRAQFARSSYALKFVRSNISGVSYLTALQAMSGARPVHICLFHTAVFARCRVGAGSHAYIRYVVCTHVR
jgi:hypothetical protein